MPKVDTIKKFGKFVKEKRQKLGMSQAELALATMGKENCQDHISKLENGKLKGMHSSTMDKILEALGADFNFIEY